ncbi:hypothetical protein LSH36_9g14067 [Paralvinella palmiformis]|uniref:MULE transposase domain-containing protein n=1 Tax=Paralvinella palmiformis TaxID=53620 RepID=A0AAD9NJK1_9ANNE|nr:hypothetical protein LSH36_9g14067 [Paralvinella palmiformis]
MDFDQAAVNAVTNTIDPHVHIQGCFYHLTQSTWKKIQSMGLVPHVPCQERCETFLPRKYTRWSVDSSGILRVHICLWIIPAYPTTTFSPTLWNVNEATLKCEVRTNNICETWNRAFASLVGHAHPTAWALIEAFRNDYAIVESTMFL